MNIYGVVWGQVVTAGMGEVIDLNLPAIKAALDMYEVPLQYQGKWSGRLMYAFREMIKIRKIQEGNNAG